ncbi:MAG: TRM11 family SAM-dependent methyltransferase [bacterium]
MDNQKEDVKTERELREAILQEKTRGTPDKEIGQKYGVTLRYIERVITQTQGINISGFPVPKKIKTLHPPDFNEQQTTVWSFKQRGNWATHSGEYRGNWSPYIPRNVILKYSKPGELVLDYFCGAGTTAVECKLLGRRCIALDINDKAIELAKKNVDFNEELKQLTLHDEKSPLTIYEPELLVGDARDLSLLEDNSVDLICAHPPYANIIHYTHSQESDLSFLETDDFLTEMSKVARESFRVLKPGRQCAILIGDTRRKRYVVPLGFKLIDVYLNAGFKLRELVIKRQHNCKTTGFWYAKSVKYNFLLLAHEYLPILEKPNSSVSSEVRDRGEDNGRVIPPGANLLLKNDLDQLETTTVWIFPEKDGEERLNKNVIDRYAQGGRYSTIHFVSGSQYEAQTAFEEGGHEDQKLLFIKSPFLGDNPSRAQVECYLREAPKVIEQELPNLTPKGFLVIQTRDVRVEGYIEPLAQRIIDRLSLANLRLKEIIVVTHEEPHSPVPASRDHLDLIHQYLLVYEVQSEVKR